MESALYLILVGAIILTITLELVGYLLRKHNESNTTASKYINIRFYSDTTYYQSRIFLL